MLTNQEHFDIPVHDYHVRDATNRVAASATLVGVLFKYYKTSAAESAPVNTTY
jgi:hypothetical protein